MTDGDLLLKAVLAHPDEDTPRLVYADWLEEHGEPDRAEFVRVQCEAERIRGGGCAVVLRADCDGTREWCIRCRLIGRERELLSPDPPGPPSGVPWSWMGAARDLIPSGALWHDHLTFRRGFVGAAACAAADFTEHVARAVFAAHPVTAVRLSDREPVDSGDVADGVGGPDWAWVAQPGVGIYTADEPRQYLPRPLWDQLTGYFTAPSARVRARRYPTRDAALSALSAACVAYGRRLAGLPPLLPPG